MTLEHFLMLVNVGEMGVADVELPGWSDHDEGVRSLSNAFRLGTSTFIAVTPTDVTPPS